MDLSHTSLGGSLASNLGEGVLLKTGIEDSVRDLVTIDGDTVVRIDARRLYGARLRGK